VIYNYIFQDDHESLDVAAIQEMKNRTGGDGIHEFVFAQASGLKVAAQSDLDQIQDVILQRKAKPLIRGSFSSWTKGWSAGQWFTIKWPRRGIKEQRLYVVTVEKVIRSSSGTPQVLSDIEYSSVPRGIVL